MTLLKPFHQAHKLCLSDTDYYESRDEIPFSATHDEAVSPPSP